MSRQTNRLTEGWMAVYCNKSVKLPEIQSHIENAPFPFQMELIAKPLRWIISLCGPQPLSTSYMMPNLSIKFHQIPFSG